jgi:hypothetical protein
VPLRIGIDVAEHLGPAKGLHLLENPRAALLDVARWRRNQETLRIRQDLLALTVVIAFWDGHRLLAAGLVTGVFAAISLLAASVVYSRSQHRPRFLAATARELQRDAEALRDGDHAP